MLDGTVSTASEAVVVAIQPNVPMDLVKSNDDMRMLTARHFEMSEAALSQLADDEKPRLVIWPESPMNFTYGTDSQLQRIAKRLRAEASRFRAAELTGSCAKRRRLQLSAANK